MLQNVLFVLLIIGIILAVLVGLLVLLLVLPFTYKMQGQFDNDKKQAEFVTYWLLHLIYFKLEYLNAKVKYVFRICGIPVARREMSSDSIEKYDEEYDDDQIFEELVEDFEGNINIQERKDIPNKKKKKKIKEEKVILEDGDEILVEEKKEDRQDEEDTATFTGKIKSFFAKIKEIFGKIKQGIIKIKKVYAIVKSKSFKLALYYVKDIVIKILHHIKPKKMVANIEFGCDSPDKTGKILAGLGMLYGIIKIDTKKIKIMPDFENKKLLGDIYMRGRFRLGFLIVQVLKIYSNKNVNYIIKKFKQK